MKLVARLIFALSLALAAGCDDAKEKAEAMFLFFFAAFACGGFNVVPNAGKKES